MITITAEQIERVNLILSGVPGGIEKALSSTIRRANNTVRSETLKGITTVYAITRQNVRAETTIKVRTQSSDGGIVGTVLFAGHKIPLYRFNVSPTIPIQRATVSAAVLAGNGRTPFQDAFIARMQSGHTGMFERDGSKRLPIMCQSYAEAVAALGYSDDWEKYPICEAIYSQFKLYGVAPVVFVNVLDPAKHKKSVAEQNYPVADGKVLLPLEALKNTVKVTSYTAGTDYELFYEGENLILEVLDGGSIPAETGELTITFDAVDPSKINENDIIGGFDTSTKKYSGLELIDKVFPKYGIVPDLIVAPGWSDKSNVAAVMTAKADAINTVFTGAKALIDADTNTVRHYADVPAWKKAQNMNSKAEILCWPMFGLGDRAFHASVHAAGLMGKTDSDNGGCPAESPSNKSLQIDRAMLADGTTVLLDLAQANYLNSNGIVTALNFIGSYVLWGDETACFPADTDVKNYFISVSRMFGWVARSVILTYWSKIDKKMTRRLIDSIVDSVNIWLNGLVSEEKLLGARVEFLDEENSTTALMAGKAVFHIYMTPASPMRECEFVLEYDADYVTAALSA